MTEKLPPNNEASRQEQPIRLNKHPEFAMKASRPLSIDIDKSTIDSAFEAAILAQIDPENPQNKPLLDPENLNKLFRAFKALSANETVKDDITAIKYDPTTKQLQAISNSKDKPLPPIPLLETIASQVTIEGQSREDTYPNVRLVFALTARALSELDQEKEHLSDKALSITQICLQKIRGLTIHYPLASMADGLNKGQIASLLYAINLTTAYDPVRAALWKNKDPLQKALDKLEDTEKPRE